VSAYRGHGEPPTVHELRTKVNWREVGNDGALMCANCEQFDDELELCMQHLFGTSDHMTCDTYDTAERIRSAGK
jgi:hypothetical protein